MAREEQQDPNPLPEAVIFDMDGVVTRTATLHAAAWKDLFDDFLRRHSETSGVPFKPFDAHADYLTYVDGRPRYEGVRSFLASRGIELPEGDPEDLPKAQTVYGLGKRKDALFESALRKNGVEIYASSIALIHALRDRGVRTAVVTSSRHGREILTTVGIAHLFDTRVDGIDIDDLGLKSKPEPDALLKCARTLDVTPMRSVVIDDAVSGVEAARNGEFGLVVGIDRGGNQQALEAHGADVVVNDLSELSVEELSTRLLTREQEIAWRVEQTGFDPAREHEMESIFTVGNGYLGVRGALDTPLPGSLGDLLIAGIYGRKQPKLPYSEPEFMTVDRGEYQYSELVSLPFPFNIQLRACDELLILGEGRWRRHRRILDLRRGILEGESLFEVNGRRTRVATRRLASLADVHLLLQEVSVQLENYSGTLEFDAPFATQNIATAHPHIEPLPSDSDSASVDLAVFRTKASGFEIALAARTTLVGSDKDAAHWRVPARVGETLTFRRIIAVYTNRDLDDPASVALRRVSDANWADYDSAINAHTKSWRQVWERADVHVSGQPAIEQALRFNAYHLRSAVDHDPRVSIGARGLSGRGYEGHVFWDVEIFMLPFFIHTFPDLAHTLLRYRYHTLDGARRRARELGYRGACYAWESTVTGEDTTPRKILLRHTGKVIPIFTGTEQIHVTADVAYGVWRYWEATFDHEFLRTAGAEILAETACFWASRCTQRDGGYHIDGVVGPDEYHHTVNDNAYTNWLARFNLEKGVWALKWLKQQFPQDRAALDERLGIATDTLEEWAAVAHELYCPQPNADGVIEQFAGFFKLEDYPLAREERLHAPVSRLFDWEKINRLKLIKQADVLMLLHLFPDKFARDIVAANYRYYEPLTDHGSSLSPAIHATIATRLGLREDAERYWRESLWLDLSNAMSNSALGVHPACMGGTWQGLVFGFLGVNFTDKGAIADAEAGMRLPKSWRSVALKLAWRGQRYPLEVKR
jgi:alpha,alpha-trehalose phosphorylase